MISAFGSSTAGWLAILFTVAAGIVAVMLRRLRKTPPLVRRMRPHYVLGYGALTLAVVHVSFAMGSMRGEDSNGLWAAAGALVALGAQTFVGASLQDPGGYRRSLRTWHIGILTVLVILLVWHVTANAALGQ